MSIPDPVNLTGHVETMTGDTTNVSVTAMDTATHRLAAQMTEAPVNGNYRLRLAPGRTYDLVLTAYTDDQKENLRAERRVEVTDPMPRKTSSSPRSR